MFKYLARRCRTKSTIIERETVGSRIDANLEEVMKMGDARTPNANACEAPGLCGGSSSCATLIPAFMAAFTPPASSNLNQDQYPPNGNACSFTNAPAGRKPIGDYAGLGRVRVGHGVRTGS